MDKGNKRVTFEANCIMVDYDPKKHQAKVYKGELGKVNTDITPDNEIVKTLKGEKFYTPDEIRAAKEARAKAKGRAEGRAKGDTRA